MFKYHFNNEQRQRGAALIVSVLYVAVMLAIVLALTAAILPKLRSSAVSKNSVAALYAAESGLEWCLYYYVLDADPGQLPQMNNEAEITNENGQPFDEADCAALQAHLPVKVLGTYNGTTRAFEISF